MTLDQDFLLSQNHSELIVPLLRFVPKGYDHDRRIRWAEANAIPICAMTSDAILRSSETKDWAETREIALGRYPKEKRTWFNEYSAVAKALDERGIPICLTKTHGPFPFWSGNIDAIVPEKRFDEAVRIVEDKGLVRLYSCDEPSKLLFKRFSGGKATISLHLHARVVWDSTFVYSEQSIPNSSIVDEKNRIRVISDDAVIATILSHAFVENKCIRLMDLLVVREVIKRGPQAWDGAKAIARLNGWERIFKISAKAFVEANSAASRMQGTGVLDPTEMPIDASGWDPVERSTLARVGSATAFPTPMPTIPTKILLVSRIFRIDDMPHFESGFSRMGFYLSSYIMRRLGRGLVTGKIIGISGPDGSGKTTFIEGLKGSMAELGIPVHTYWSRYGTAPGNLNRSSNRTVKTQGGTDEDGGFAVKRATPRTAIKLLESVLRLSFKGASARFFRDNIVFDRYFLDTETDYFIETGKEGGALIRIGRSLVIKPDIHLLLWADKGVISSRTNESEMKVDESISAYERILSEQESGNITRVDTKDEVGKLLDGVIPVLARELR